MIDTKKPSRKRGGFCRLCLACVEYNLRTMGPTAEEWSFSEIRLRDPPRADLLENAPSFDEIIARLIAALRIELQANRVRFGTDFSDLRWRAFLQFSVSREFYDAFFNSRTGYRAQYWIAPEAGIAADREIAQALAPLFLLLPSSLTAREVRLDEGYTREDVDVGERSIGRSFVEASLSSHLSKTWICERLLACQRGPLKNLANDFLASAIQLKIPRWGTALAPHPLPESSWIDIKGAFINGSHYQPKSQEVRARDLNARGWS